MELKIAFCIYGDGMLDIFISQAISFINTNLHGGAEELKLTFGETPPYHKFNSCYFLSPWDITDIAAYPLNTVCYHLLWKLKGGDSPCWAGGTWGPLYGIKNKSVCSEPYNVWWWDTNSDWGHELKAGAAIIIHETHHALASMLFDLFDIPIVLSKAEHTYGVTIPHIDFMSAFGYGTGDDYVFSQWCYQQLTPQMVDTVRSTYTRILKISSVPQNADLYVDG